MRSRLQPIYRKTAGLFVLLLGLSFLVSGFHNKGFSIRFEPVFGKQAVVLDSVSYVSSSGDTLNISLFRFYVGEVGVFKKGRYQRLAKSCYLIDAADESSLRLSHPGLNASFDSLALTIGIDSLTSVSGALSGALDPAKGMYWAWNTGYINAKLEGHSPRCKTLHQAFEFHIGGYRQPYLARRRVILKLPGHSGEVVVKADVGKWLEGISLAELNSIVSPGKEACKMADRYQNMFYTLP